MGAASMDSDQTEGIPMVLTDAAADHRLPHSDPNGTDLSVMDVHEAAVLRVRYGVVWSVVERVSVFV